MKHEIIWAALILGSFIMQAEESRRGYDLARNLWGIVGLLGFIAAQVLA
jgi:hypothetical protein